MTPPPGQRRRLLWILPSPAGTPQGDRLGRLFRFIIACRWWIVAAYAIALPPAIWFAIGVKQDNSPDRLIVRTDPDYLAKQEFARAFGETEYALVIAEAEDPFAADVVARLDALETQLAGLKKVEINSALQTFRRARAGFAPTPESVAAFRAFATGSELFRKQRLVGDHYLTIAVLLDVHSSDERNATLATVDAALAPIERSPAPLLRLRKVGEPYVNAYLDQATRSASLRCFPIFGLFIVVTTLFLYRSWRTLFAFLLCIGASVALTVGFVGATGGTFTIVSSLVPMTILIVATATLVYLHSRFVERPTEDPDAPFDVDEHQVFALGNKFLACTVSTFATAVGFAALVVSSIRPIRAMGVWVAIGLVFTWLTVFTLFPALQRIFRTPIRPRKMRVDVFGAISSRIPRFSYRYRWMLVGLSLALCGVGAVSLFGFPGLVTPMKLLTNPAEYISPNNPLFHDTRFVERNVSGLGLTDVWLKTETFGRVTDPEVLRGLDRFQRALDAEPRFNSVIGPTTILRLLRYVGGKGDALPADADLDAWELLGEKLDTLVPQEPMLQRFFARSGLNQTHYSVVTEAQDHAGYQATAQLVRDHWKATVADNPALASFTLTTVGSGPLQAKVAHAIVPTLVESFGLTVAIIFFAFLLVFRNGPARVMAMIPSLFAILVMFAVMRLFGISLNIATILIASTVLGTSENDQIHFFFHYLERASEGGTTEQSLRHALRVAGRAIFVATMINTAGFLAFVLTDVPPMRQFALLSAVALVLSMIADFTALPAALWIVFREKPDE